MEATIYVQINQYGSAIVAGTGIHVSAIGIAHESGQTDDELLSQFKLSQEQLYGALAYYYGHRDEIVARENAANQQAEELGRKGAEKLEAWRKKQNR